MALLNDEIRNTVKAMWADLPEPVTFKMFTQSFECEFCRETRELVEEVAALSDKLSLEVYDFEKDPEEVARYGIDKIPAIAVVGAKDYGIRLYGMPSGYEFGSLIEVVKLVSTGKTELAKSTMEALGRLKQPAHIQVFITPTWPYCPRAVLLAYQMAMASDLVRADMVEVVEFPHLAQKYQVMGVPRTVINETIQIEGAVPEPMLMREFAKLLEGNGAQ